MRKTSLPPPKQSFKTLTKAKTTQSSSRSTSKRYTVNGSLAVAQSHNPPSLTLWDFEHGGTDLIATISDPEHPLTLGELAVVNLQHITVTDRPSEITSRVLVELTPTINHCSLATVIGLGVRVRLEQALPPRFRLDVRIREGTHATGDQVNKQLNDKERVASALENETLMGVVGKMLETCK